MRDEMKPWALLLAALTAGCNREEPWPDGHPCEGIRPSDATCDTFTVDSDTTDTDPGEVEYCGFCNG